MNPNKNQNRFSLTAEEVRHIGADDPPARFQQIRIGQGGLFLGCEMEYKTANGWSRLVDLHETVLTHNEPLSQKVSPESSGFHADWAAPEILVDYSYGYIQQLDVDYMVNKMQGWMNDAKAMMKVVCEKWTKDHAQFRISVTDPAKSLVVFYILPHNCGFRLLEWRLKEESP
jgi:hypothetical protein